MPKTKLTNAMRDKAVKALYSHATDALAVELATEEANLFKETLHHLIGKDVKKIKDVPKGWLPSAYTINVMAGGWNLYLNNYSVGEGKQVCLNNYGSLSGTGEHAPMPWFMVNGGNDRSIQDADLIARIQAHAQKLRGTQEKARSLFGKIKSTIAGFATVEALLKEMPDLKELCPDLTAPPPPSALVPAAKVLLCDIAAFRGDERPGCPCDEQGEPLAQAA